MLTWCGTLTAALIPMLLGFVYYHPKVMGTMWMQASGVGQEKMSGARMGIIFGVSFILALMLSLQMHFIVIHQMHLGSIVNGMPELNDANSAASKWLKFGLDNYGHNFRTFKHGAFHGTIAGFFFALPIVGTGALFERKGAKYILINGLYWILCLALMGGTICALG
jgi:hypothetical protein